MTEIHMCKVDFLLQQLKMHLRYERGEIFLAMLTSVVK
jgi:hypothetical protein